MIKKIVYVCIALFLSLFFPLFAKAETHIDNLDTGGFWTKEESPYILDDYVYVSPEFTLTINPGVVVMSASTTDGYPFSINLAGQLHTEGTESEPVRFVDLGAIYSTNNSNSISYTNFENTGINTTQATTTLSHVKIRGADQAVVAKRSVIDITDSEISNNKIGIYSDLWTQGPVLSSIANKSAIGGIGNALNETDPKQNIISIHNSIIEHNDQYSIQNLTPNTIDATQNWWGSEAGPGNSIAGAVSFNPWLTKDPRKKITCCSNVLFLPGLEASRLYKPGQGLFKNTSLEFWEPFGNDDVKKLYLDKNGSSTDPTIFTKDIMDDAYGIKGIYGKFIAMMNGVVAEKKINEWLPYAYDWRMYVPDIVTKNTLYSTTTKNLIHEAERLARTSKTGKLSIIAHSNGGLVAKMLGEELRKRGEENLIDKVVFVGVPQLGTPQAIASLLHGDSQSILNGFTLSNAIARGLGLNMLGAYGLLPSKDFFNQIFDPVITFASSTIDTYDDLVDFFTGKIDPRKQPKESDLKTPAVLSTSLLEKSENMHDLLDSFQFGTSTSVLSIAGWGIPTVSSVYYGGKDPQKRESPEGDGTVLSKSVAGYGGLTAYFNQGLMKHNNKDTIEHADLLEANPVRNLLASVVTADGNSLSSLLLPEYLSFNEPQVSDYAWMSWLRVSVHSPVDIDVYDSHGGHIGLVPLPGHSDSDIKMIENTLGGHYEEFAGGKYITVPADGTYSVQLKGTDVGTFTFNVEKFDNYMNEVASSTYANMPVNPLLVASTTINSFTIAPQLSLDFDGDGKIDMKVGQSTSTDPFLNLTEIKAAILALHLDDSLEKKLLQKIDHIESAFKKGKFIKATKLLKKLEEKTGNKHWNLKKITEAEKQALKDMISDLLDQLETAIE